MRPLLLCLFLFATIAPTLAADIELPAEAPEHREVTLEEVWRLGGEDEEDVLLGMIGRGQRDAEGRVYLLDNQLSQVLVLDPEGELITTLGREGEGPGEMSHPADFFLNNVDQVGVTQGFPGKIILLNMDGTPGGSIPLGKDPATGGFVFAGEVAKRGEHLVISHGSAAFDQASGKMKNTHVLVALDQEGNELARFAEHNGERDLARQAFDEEADFSELNTWVLGPRHVFTCPVRDEYVVNIKAMDGSLEGRYTRPFETRKRTDEEKEEVTAGMMIVVDGQRQEIKSKILDTAPAISSLQAAPDGTLYVENCYQIQEQQEGDVVRRYDVISPDGKLVEELGLVVPGYNRDLDRLQFLDGEYFLWMRNMESAQRNMRSSFGVEVEGEEDLGDVEPLEIVLCRIPQ
jgi:hypothetical protein